MSTVVVRRAADPDLPWLSAIEQSGAQTFADYGQPLADGSPPTPLEDWEAALDAGLLWVADDPACGPVGFLRAEIVDDCLYVVEVDVQLEHQRRGHGRRLIDAAIAAARAAQLQAVTLTTFRDIPWNAPFYASMGFAEVDAVGIPMHLAEHLADEAARGFKGRCAMRRAL